MCYLQAKGAKGRSARASLRAATRQESVSQQTSEAEDNDEEDGGAGSDVSTQRCTSAALGIARHGALSGRLLRGLQLLMQPLASWSLRNLPELTVDV